MIATLLGGTGLTGSVLLRQLIADPAIAKVVSVSRRPSGITVTKLTELFFSDLSELPSMAERIRGDLYFCCLGTTIKSAGSRENFEKVDHDAVVDFATIASAHGAKSFALISAMGANATSRVFYNRVKGQTEKDVQALGLRSLIIFRPALLVGARDEFRLGERIATRTLVPLATLLPVRARKSLLTDVETLAARMLAEAKAAPAGTHIIRASDI